MQMRQKSLSSFRTESVSGGVRAPLVIESVQTQNKGIRSKTRLDFNLKQPQSMGKAPILSKYYVPGPSSMLSPGRSRDKCPEIKDASSFILIEGDVIIQTMEHSAETWRERIRDSGLVDNPETPPFLARCQEGLRDGSTFIPRRSSRSGGVHTTVILTVSQGGCLYSVTCLLKR